MLRWSPKHSAPPLSGSRNTRDSDAMSMARHYGMSFGWRVVGAAFVLSLLGWGMGWLFRPADLFVGDPGETGLDDRPDLDSCHAAFYHWRGRGREPEDTACTIWSSCRDKGSAISLAVRVLGWAPRDRALATLRGDIVEWCRLTCDPCGCSERYRLSVVCMQPALLGYERTTERALEEPSSRRAG